MGKLEEGVEELVENAVARSLADLTRSVEEMAREIVNLREEVASLKRKEKRVEPHHGADGPRHRNNEVQEKVEDAPPMEIKELSLKEEWQPEENNTRSCDQDKANESPAEKLDKRHLMSCVPEYIRNFQEAVGASQKEMAASLGVGPSCFSAIKWGRRKPTQQQERALELMKLTEADDLLDYDPEEEREYTRRALEAWAEGRFDSQAIRALIEESGLSFYRFAHHCGVSKGTLNNWLRGKHQPCKDALVNLLKIKDEYCEDISPHGRRSA